MKLSTRSLYVADSSGANTPFRKCHKSSSSRRRRRNEDSPWKTAPSLLFLAAALLASLGSRRSPFLGNNILVEASDSDESGGPAAHVEESIENAEATNNSNNPNTLSLDAETQELFNKFLTELNDYTYIGLLLQEPNHKKLAQETRGPPVMTTRRRSLLEQSVHRHYTVDYLRQLQDQTKERANEQERNFDDNPQHQEEVTEKTTKLELQEAIQAYLYQTPVDANIKSNPKRHRHNAATSNGLGLPPFPPSSRKENAKLLRDMFYKSYNAYMEYSFPASELLPLTCQPGTFDLIRLPALTLIDALDTLLVFGDSLEFAKSVERLRQFDLQHKSNDGTGGIFSVNQNVSVFETTIRVLGGLLSAHQMAVAYLKNKETSSHSRTGLSPKTGSNKLPVVSLVEVYGGPEEEYLIPSEDEIQILMDYEQKSTAGAHDSRTGADSSCSIPGQDQTQESVSPNEMKPPDPENPSSANNDWTDYCGSGVLSLEDCAAAKTASKVVNRTAAAILRQQKLEREPQWEYDGFLLELALDIGERLLPAFDTKTGIPYGTVHLLQGVPSGETTVASLAGGGTLSLEFELLSRLTGDLRFGRAAKLAIRGLWMRRSPLQLFGKHIDIQRGVWTEQLSGIGSNSDSFLEYLLKHYLLFPEEEDFWVMLQSSYAGVFHGARLGEWYADVDMRNGLQNWPKGMAKRVLESLMAFYPGLQTLVGEFVPAARSMNSFFMVREFLGFLPERFSYSNWKVDGGVSSGAATYPLRPELLESCYFMHRATKREGDAQESSSSWQWAADFALHHLERLTRAKCGYASVRGLSPATGNLHIYPEHIKLDNDMPSFFLSETIKYLYLTFDDDNIIHNDKDRDWIFTTEAHPLHYVPTFENAQNARRTSQEDSPQLVSAKHRLRTKLNNLKLQREGHAFTSQQEISSDKAVSPYYLMEELWSYSTQPRDYRASIQDVFQAIRETESRGVNSTDMHPLKTFFGTKESLLDSMPLSSSVHMYPEDNNLAHMTWNSLGLGSGYTMKKACANIYAPEMTWVDALNGGVLDYTDVYVTAFSETHSDYPSSSESANFLLTSAEALSVHGSGIYLGNTHSAIAPDEVCRIARRPNKTASEASLDSSLSQTPEPETGKSAQSQGGIQHVELSGIGKFEVSAFPEGSGFFMQHTESRDSLMTTFIIDSMEGLPAGDATIMIYASMARNKAEPLGQESPIVAEDNIVEAENGTGNENKVHGNNANQHEGDRSPWKNFVGPRLASWFKNRRRRATHDGSDSTMGVGEPHRAVVISDLEDNAFHCEVNIIRRPFSSYEESMSNQEVGTSEGGDEGAANQFTLKSDEIVASFPCAPALFGPSRISRLVETNGVFMEHVIELPDGEDEFGCKTDDIVDDNIPTVNVVSGEAPSEGGVEEKIGSSSSDKEEDECTITVEDSACENKTIQLLQRGSCSFYSKTANQKQNANGVIVINTDDQQLFVMSNGEEVQAGMPTDDIPVSVLVTGLDGEEIVSLVQSERVEANSGSEMDSFLLAQINIFRQEIEFDSNGSISTDTENIVWPVVRGNEESVQVLAEGGWGIHSVRKDGGSIRDSASAGDLQLFLLRHSAVTDD